MFDHVTFGYDSNRNVLQDMSFTIPAGKTVAILGATGSGKSSIVHLMQRLFEPQSGRITIGGVDIQKIDRSYLRAHVGLVLQEPFLYSKTLRDNVGIAVSHPSQQAIERAAVDASALSFIEDSENGWNTVVGERGVTLSGGQKQRIAIARAVINEPKVLLLDEPLGALDLKLRRQMQLELKRLQKRLGITFIYITHDQEEAINMSDRIGVMHEGVLEQLGTPNEVYYQPKTSYVADFVGNANILRLGGETFAIRSENILMNGETVCTREAVVVEKSFAGGQLRILFRLPDGQTLTASRYGIDNDLQPGQQVKIGWDAKDAVKVIDNDKDENHK